jgi:UDP-N-acetylglucosamine/UDP-N-acetylgalactosamine diphosphorylase
VITFQHLTSCLEEGHHLFKDPLKDTLSNCSSHLSRVSIPRVFPSRMDSVTSAITSTLEKLHILQEDSTPSFIPPTDDQISSLRKTFAERSQDHVFTFWDSLTEQQQASLYNQLISINPTRLSSITSTLLTPNSDPKSPVGTDLSPIPPEHCASTLDASTSQLKEWRDSGLQAIAEGKVAVLLMAGGQGTRLGSSAPKGCYDIGLPSGKSLFQIQAERLLKLQELAAEEFGDRGKEVVIPWYIMTSGPTRKETDKFLKSKGYFGLNVPPPHSSWTYKRRRT